MTPKRTVKKPEMRKICDRCNGSGKVLIRGMKGKPEPISCPKCMGKGWVRA